MVRIRFTTFRRICCDFVLASLRTDDCSDFFLYIAIGSAPVLRCFFPCMRFRCDLRVCLCCDWFRCDFEICFDCWSWDIWNKLPDDCGVTSLTLSSPHQVQSRKHLVSGAANCFLTAQTAVLVVSLSPRLVQHFSTLIYRAPALIDTLTCSVFDESDASYVFFLCSSLLFRGRFVS